jgi:hypothetical protein
MGIASPTSAGVPFLLAAAAAFAWLAVLATELLAELSSGSA